MFLTIPFESSHIILKKCIVTWNFALQDLDVEDTVPEATLPETIPAELDSMPQDAQGQPEDQVPCSGDNDGAPGALSQHSGVAADKQIMAPKDRGIDGEALDDHELQSLASTMSLGPPWETEFYQYKREGDRWMKSVKEKYASLAIARGWKLGPIPATEDPCCTRDAPIPALSIPISPAPTPMATPAADEVAMPAAATASPASMVATPAAEATPTAEATLPASVATPAAEATLPAMVAMPAAEATLPASTVATRVATPAAEVAPPATALAATAMVAMPAMVATPAAIAAPAAPAGSNDIRIDWTTHKKEGMRLKRLMEESAHGAEQFPHMHKIWQSGRDGQKQLLRDWVLKNGNAGSIEAQIVLQRSKSSNLGKQRELLTVKQMREEKNWPDKKIRAILSRGDYVEDEDCPDAEELRRYWCNTSTTLNENEEVRQQSTMTIQAAASADAVDSLMNGPGAVGRRSDLSGNSMDQIMQSLQNASSDPGHLTVFEHGNTYCFLFILHVWG